MNDTYNSLRFLFPQAPLETLRNTEKCIQFLSGFQPVQYHCCPSSCVCYTSPYEALSTCPKCKADRYKSDGKTPQPQSYFHYLPLIPRLHAMVSNMSYAKKVQYQLKHQHNPNKITDHRLDLFLYTKIPQFSHFLIILFHFRHHWSHDQIVDIAPIAYQHSPITWQSYSRHSEAIPTINWPVITNFLTKTPISQPTNIA